MGCDLKVVKMLRQRGLGNSVSRLRQNLEELHGEEMLKRTAHYLSDCQTFTESTKLGLITTSPFQPPPLPEKVPSYQWMTSFLYRDAGISPPEVLYVDRNCCGPNFVGRKFQKWRDIQVRLDIWHFMRRIASTCTTESHPLYPKFLRLLSGCSFQWCSEDLEALKGAKEDLLAKEGVPSGQPIDGITKKELSLHCCRTTRNPEDITDLISELLKVYCGEHGRDFLGRPPPKPEDITDLISELLKVYCGEHGRDLLEHHSWMPSKLRKCGRMALQTALEENEEERETEDQTDINEGFVDMTIPETRSESSHHDLPLSDQAMENTLTNVTSTQSSSTTLLKVNARNEA
ncbi:unnamed protein product [Mytilus edulis]|uniref:DUF6729 domain-containing protein n=1 Tax=Mytilus edulis TaxID=6550 RepID=A0A8S3RXX9_MYTED|nr:unnamed protein product [Mytilus edulis]